MTARIAQPVGLLPLLPSTRSTSFSNVVAARSARRTAATPALPVGAESFRATLPPRSRAEDGRPTYPATRSLAGRGAVLSFEPMSSVGGR